MMAASSASIVAAHPADQEAILGTAAVSNLITTVLGVYIGIYIALPLADRVYRLLTRGQDDGAAMVATTGPGTGAGASATTAPARSQADDVAVNRAFREQVGAPSAEVKLPLWLSLGVLTVLGIGAASVSAKALSWQIIGGYAILLALVSLGLVLAKATRKISPIVWIATVGAYVSSPWFFGAEAINSLVNSVDFLSIATIMLTLAGLSLGKDVPLLRRIGWKIVPVGLVAITALFPAVHADRRGVGTDPRVRDDVTAVVRTEHMRHPPPGGVGVQDIHGGRRSPARRARSGPAGRRAGGIRQRAHAPARSAWAVTRLASGSTPWLRWTSASPPGGVTERRVRREDGRYPWHAPVTSAKIVSSSPTFLAPSTTSSSAAEGPRGPSSPGGWRTCQR